MSKVDINRLLERSHGALLKHQSSSVMRPLGWICLALCSVNGVTIPATMVALVKGASWWVLVLGGIPALALAAVVGVYCIAYMYLIVKDRGALRSEEFTLQQMAIERGLLGDSKFGLIEPPSEKRTATQVQPPASPPVLTAADPLAPSVAGEVNDEE